MKKQNYKVKNKNFYIGGIQVVYKFVLYMRPKTKRSAYKLLTNSTKEIILNPSPEREYIKNGLEQTL